MGNFFYFADFYHPLSELIYLYYTFFDTLFREALPLTTKKHRYFRRSLRYFNKCATFAYISYEGLFNFKIIYKFFLELSHFSIVKNFLRLNEYLFFKKLSSTNRACRDLVRYLQAQLALVREEH